MFGLTISAIFHLSQYFVPTIVPLSLSKDGVCLILERCTYMWQTHSSDLKCTISTIILYTYLNHQIFLDDMDMFQNYCVVYERQRTVPQLRIIPFEKPEDQYVVQVNWQSMYESKLK